MKTIWLCSWYPNENDKFRGDFIQRQAIAVSAYAQIDVIHVVFCAKNSYTITQVNSNLTEHIFYQKKKNKISDALTFVKIHQKFITDYIKNNGKPTLVHVQIPMPSGRIALKWVKQFSIPYILSEHYGIYNENVSDNFKTRNFLFKFFTKRIIQNATYFLPVSKSLGEEVNEMVVKKDFTPVPNVVDTNMFSYVKKGKPEKLKFIHVSDFSNNKNVKGILQAIKLVLSQRNDFEFIFIGNKKENIHEYAKELKVDSCCTFISEISYEEVAAYASQSYVGVLFSLSESQSCVVLEWLCSGLPVISSAVGGVKELINETNGILVPSQDVDALAKAIQAMLENYQNYNGESIAINARSLYSYEAVGQQFFNIYKKIETR